MYDISYKIDEIVFCIFPPHFLLLVRYIVQKTKQVDMKFETKKKITDVALEHELICFEGSRMCFFYTQHLVVYQVFLKHHEWPHHGYVFVSPSRDHHSKWYWFVKNQAVIDSYLQRFLDNPKLLERMDQYLTEECEKGTARLKRAEYRSLSSDVLRDLAEFYFEQFANIMTCAGTCRMIDRGVGAQLQRVFFGKSDVDQCIATVAITKKPSATVREERALLELAARVEREEVSLESDIFATEVHSIHDNFTWGVMGYFDEKPKSIGDYINEIQKILKDGAMKTLSAFNEKLKDGEAKRKKLLASLDANGIALAEVASYATYLKDHFKFSENKLEYCAEPLFKEIASRSKVTVAFVKDLHPKEILALIDGQSIDEKFVLERTAHNVVFATPEAINTLVGTEADEFEKRYIPLGDSAQKEFKGRVASGGFAKGIAKVILGGKDFAKLHQGDILVVSNTSPDFVPILRKSAAIVAEEGGLTAHVSVVSREFGIPCIVGIANITEILKDGDLVEVDANEGVVRKL